MTTSSTLTAGPALDYEVGRALGIDVTLGGDCLRHFKQQHSDRVVRACMPFKPSTIWTDAMRAARKVDLFAKYFLGKVGDQWAVGTFSGRGFVPRWTASTGPLAICAAILKQPASG